MKKNIKGLNYKFLKNIVLSSSLGFCAACNHENIFNQDEAKPTPDDNKDQKDTTKLKENTEERIDPSKNVGDTNNNPDPQIKSSTTSDETKPEGQPNIESGNDSDTDPESSSIEEGSDNNSDASDSEIDDLTTSEEEQLNIEFLEKTKNAINDLVKLTDEKLLFVYLDKIEYFINEISDDNVKIEAFEYLKDNIKFELKNNDDELCFSFNKLFWGNINTNFDNFYFYCVISKRLMDIVGCQDIYKIDLSQYSEKKIFKEVYFLIKSLNLTKEHFADKIFHFDIDKDKNLSAGWGKALKVDSVDKEKMIEYLFFIYDLNPDLVDKNFNFDSFSFNLTYNKDGRFNFELFFEDEYIGQFMDLPISNILQNFFIDSINCDWDRSTIQFLNDYGEVLWENYIFDLDYLEQKNIEIKNKPTISINKDQIFFSDIEKSPFLFSLMHENIGDFTYKLKLLQKLKNCNLVNVNNVNLDFGTDGKILKLGELDLINFIKKTQSDVKKISIDDVFFILDSLFNIFATRVSVDCIKPLGGSLIKIETDNKICYYIFDENKGFRLYDIYDKTSSFKEF